MDKVAELGYGELTSDGSLSLVSNRAHGSLRDIPKLEGRVY